MARPVSSFYAQIGIQTQLQNLTRVDRSYAYWKARKTTVSLQKDFSKNLTLPALNVKKFKLDSSLQKTPQEVDSSSGVK